MEKLPHERLREDGLYNYITDEECSVTACSKCEQFDPNKLTHREPDSLEKLRDDMNYSIIEGTYPGTAHEYLCQCAKRLTAIMERDA